LVRKFSLQYAAYTSFGSAAGPVACLLCSKLPEFTLFGGFVEFNRFTTPGWLAFVLITLYTIAVIVYYTDPYQPGFFKYEDEEKGLRKPLLAEAKKAELPQPKSLEEKKDPKDEKLLVGQGASINEAHNSDEEKKKSSGSNRTPESRRYKVLQ
jgi:hypothetical protein